MWFTIQHHSFPVIAAMPQNPGQSLAIALWIRSFCLTHLTLRKPSHSYTCCITNLASPISYGTSHAPWTVGEFAWADFALSDNSIEENATTLETKGILDDNPKRFDH
jgi:hypothetical protein